MRLQESAHRVDRLLEQSFGSRQANTVDCAFGASPALSMRRRVVRHDEERVWPDRTNSRDTLYPKSGRCAIQVVQIGLDTLRTDLGPPGSQLGAPDIAPGVVHDIGILRPMPDRL